MYISPVISALGNKRKEHEFYHKNGIKVVREVLNLDMSTSKPYDYYNAFTGESLQNYCK